VLFPGAKEGAELAAEAAAARAKLSRWWGGVGRRAYAMHGRPEPLEGDLRNEHDDTKPVVKWDRLPAEAREESVAARVARDYALRGADSPFEALARLTRPVLARLPTRPGRDPEGFASAAREVAAGAEVWRVAVPEGASGGEAMLVKAWSGHTGGVAALCFSPDGARFATAGTDGCVLLWCR
jgi:hypothetical protein